MDDLTRKALAATDGIRRSPGYGGLAPGERGELDAHLERIESVLRGGGSVYGGGAQPAVADPYAVPFATPNDLRGVGVPATGRPTGTAPQAPATRPAAPPRKAGTEVLGERARRALDAVDFPSFIAELIQGTFQAVVDATAQQVREYARLVADISRSVDDFTRDNVSLNQARDWLAGRHPGDLMVILPQPGETASPRITPRRSAGESPPWLVDYGLGGAELTGELAEGPLLEAGRRMLGEERLRTLATMVLMGINRIVIDDGQLRARLQFHARAREKVSAEMVAQSGGQQLGIAGRQTGMRSAVSTMVSTVDVNAQSDISIKTDLVGEVSLRFRTETFDINAFADSPTISLINRHSLNRETAAGQAAGVSAGGGGGDTDATQVPAPAPQGGDAT